MSKNQITEIKSLLFLSTVMLLSFLNLRRFDAVREDVVEITVPIPISQSPVASRLKRLRMYEERYNYKPPAPYTNHTLRDLICGRSPNYEAYFSLKHERSANDEDLDVYELLFKDEAGLGLQGSVVELGAFDGIRETNSRFFQLCLGWETLLIEGMPKTYQRLINNRPNAHRFNFAPSCSKADEVANKTVQFDNYPMTNAGVHDGSVTTVYSEKDNTIDVPCGSLTKVLLDIFPQGHVTFFSLDVEGSEPYVLQNIDFEKVFIEVMIVEIFNILCTPVSPCESRELARKIMDDAGYVRFQNLIYKSDLYIHPLSKHLERMQKSTPKNRTEMGAAKSRPWEGKVI
mmetsp:Transcript_18121/g.27423  ORF Transcript_18121/g.27423 Transcript_18121/m.27423 type:complete len:344 (-) Transcript_18121:64-1095(-)